MFARLGSVVVRHPWMTILVWIGATLAIALSAPVLQATSDQADFLPKGYESVRAQDLAIPLVGGVLRETAHAEAPKGSVAYVGGTSSVLADIQTAINRDYRVVFPAASVAILLILALLLGSVAAPWYLMASVALGFVASLGATVLVFREFRNQAGLLFTLPILMYLFVVAIGTDYNIVMVARIREETRNGLTTRAATGAAVRHTASTIAAGGVILGGTFAVLTAGNDPSLQQLGVGISVGIAVSAFVMAIFLTPALTAMFGQRAFWPGNRRADVDLPDTSTPAVQPVRSLTPPR
jgi:RND superfamily putative drug exporter